MAKRSKISCSICRPYQIDIDYGQNFNLIKNNETEENHYVSLVSFLPNLLRTSIDLLVTWGSNLVESSHHHSLANFSQSGFCQQLITFGQVSIVFPKRTGFWCHLTFNNVVKMISNLTLPIVGESVIGWGIVSSIMIPPPYPHVVLYYVHGTSRTYMYPYNRFHASSTMAVSAWHSLLYYTIAHRGKPLI